MERQGQKGSSPEHYVEPDSGNDGEYETGTRLRKCGNKSRKHKSTRP
jgi:hypothetical protein